MTSKSAAETWARYHVDGVFALRWGSFASSGLPLAVRVPSTTQLFDPSASVRAGPSRKSVTAGSPDERLPASAWDQDEDPDEEVRSENSEGKSEGVKVG